MARRASQSEKSVRGVRAEEAVARRLWWNGYTILARNYRVASGEIDIIARTRDVIAFVEVKAREDGTIIAPRDQVTAAQQRRIDSAASIYLKSAGLTDLTVRYDIAEVWLNEKGKPKRIEILEGAFGPPRR